MLDVALVTEQSLLIKGKNSKYDDSDDILLRKALLERGLTVARMAWDDFSIDWTKIKCAVICSTWNYQRHVNAFVNWLTELERSQCTLVNDIQLILWNIHKKYLLDLSANSINIPNTYFVSSRSELRTETWLNLFGSDSIVIKPAISASAVGTVLVANFAIFQQSIETDIVSDREFIVQPFMKSIKTRGELSMIFLEGVYSHAKIKKPTPRDFRVQREFGGVQEDVVPAKHEILFGQRVINTCAKILSMPVFARVDVCYDNDSQLALMELELIEPELWLQSSASAVQRLADCIEKVHIKTK